MDKKKKIIKETSADFSSTLKNSVKSKDDKNDLDRFLILVFNSPSEKREYCQKNLDDPDICYIEGKYYELVVKD